MSDWLKPLEDAVAGRTPGRWGFTTCYGVAFIQGEQRDQQIAHAVEYLKPDNATFIALMANCADELLAVVKAADDASHYFSERIECRECDMTVGYTCPDCSLSQSIANALAKLKKKLEG